MIQSFIHIPIAYTAACPSCQGTGQYTTWERRAATEAEVLRGLKAEAASKYQHLSDEDLGLALVHLRRAVALQSEDEKTINTAFLFVTAIDLEVVEQEWTWRQRAAAKGGPAYQRTNASNRLNELKQKVRLEDLVSRRVHELKKSGGEFTGRCPFHDDSTPSLAVNVEKQLWHCHGCGVGGDVVTWIELTEVDSHEFKDALRFLEGYVG